MKDYIIKVASLTAFNVAIKSHAEAKDWEPETKPKNREEKQAQDKERRDNRKHSYVDAEGNAKLSIPKTKRKAKQGNSTASLCRLDAIELAFMLSQPEVSILGQGSPFIKSIDDVVWDTNGKRDYHAIHSITPQEVDDGEGGKITITPPQLHGVIA